MSSCVIYPNKIYTRLYITIHSYTLLYHNLVRAKLEEVRLVLGYHLGAINSFMGWFHHHLLVVRPVVFSSVANWNSSLTWSIWSILNIFRTYAIWLRKFIKNCNLRICPHFHHLLVRSPSTPPVEPALQKRTSMVSGMGYLVFLVTPWGAEPRIKQWWTTRILLGRVGIFVGNHGIVGIDSIGILMGINGIIVGMNGILVVHSWEIMGVNGILMD